jgi:hypothetical protein
VAVNIKEDIEMQEKELEEKGTATSTRSKGK